MAYINGVNACYAAGIGAPEQTYEISCVPAPGSAGDPNVVKHFPGRWYTPRPVTLVRKNDAFDLNARCYNYVVSRSDTVASIVDAFGFNMTSFVQDNRDKFMPLQNVTYKLDPPTSGSMYNPTVGAAFLQADLEDFMTSVQQLAARIPGAQAPYMKCWYYGPDSAPAVPVCCWRYSKMCRAGHSGLLLVLAGLQRYNTAAGRRCGAHMQHIAT